ncbi:MAG: ABC transporter ATP-binding protein [Metamycoplasmataceae bacterium]
MNAIELINITKEFPGILANDNISLSIKKGEIHALIGENGAGKSVLMSILFGLYQPTYGKIKIFDNFVEIQDAHHANSMGIGMVHQHFKLVENFSNLENIILGSEISKNFMLDKKAAENKIKIFQNKYKIFFDLNQKTRDANVSVQQKLEIMKMLYQDAEILIFDEPSAVLSPLEIENLLETILELKASGKTIIFISHKLDEIKKIADRASVLRLGKLIKTFDKLENISYNEITNAMVGTNIVEVKNQHSQIGEETVFCFQKVFGKIIKDVSFKIHKGEIFAIAGVEGNGQEDIEYIASGIQKLIKGKLFLNNQDITKWSINKKNKNNISYIPGDRHKYAVALDIDVNDNSILRETHNKKFQRWGILLQKSIQNFSNKIIHDFDVRGSRNGMAMMRSLSGGNQQKLVVGREIESIHDFIIIIQPTRGLDIGAINNIHKVILNEKAKGKAILLISYELDEVIALADTIAVINKGHILDIKKASDFSREEIGLLMAGKTNEIKVNYAK